MEHYWNRTAAGGYNRGAMIVFRFRPGILISGVPVNVVVPSGSVSWLRDQMSASPSVLEFNCMMVEIDSLVYALAMHLDALGYTELLHQAFSAVKRYLVGKDGRRGE